MFFYCRRFQSTERKSFYLLPTKNIHFGLYILRLNYILIQYYVIFNLFERYLINKNYGF